MLTTVMVIGLAFFVVGTVWGIWRYRQEMRKPAQLVTVSAAD
jgi:membrane-associated protein